MRLPRRRARPVYRVWDEAEFLASHAADAGSNAPLEPERPGHGRVLVPVLLALVTAIVVATILTRSQSTLRGPRRHQAQARRSGSQPLASAVHLAQVSRPASDRKVGRGKAAVSVGEGRRRTRRRARPGAIHPPAEVQAASVRPRVIASVAEPSEPHEFGFER